MKIGFDLDGTLDRVSVCELALSMLQAGHEVHVISGCFLEAGEWQSHNAKFEKLHRLGFITKSGMAIPHNLRVVILDAVSHEDFDREYRLVDLGLRKGAYVSEQGIELMFDDSELYCKTMPSMCGAQIVQVLR